MLLTRALAPLKAVRRPGAFGLLAFAALAGLDARPARAQDFLANQIENLISTEDLQVEIEGLSGALTGDIRIEQLTASDTQGVFLTASDLALDWSPLALVRSNVSVENLSAGQIVLERLPVSTAPAEEEAGGGFSLPSITADIESIRIDEFVLGEAIAGTRARLSADASLTLDDDPLALAAQATIERLDQPGQIVLDVAFVPNENRLDLNVEASEPAGGLIANLLDLPGAPPVSLTINGSGPLGDFMANGALTIDGEQAAILTAQVTDVDEGRRIAATLDVAAERFVPEAYAAYVGGGTRLDVSVLQRDDGTFVINQGELSSNELLVTATGTYDPSGAANDLDFSAEARLGDTLPLNFGTPPNQASLEIASLTGSLAGALDAAEISLAAELRSAGFGDYVAQNVDAALRSGSFDVSSLTGPFVLEAVAQSVAAPEGVADRFLEGEVRITADGALTEDGLVLNDSTVSTDVATASVVGNAALDFSTFALDLSAAFDTAALSAAAIPLAGERIALSGSVSQNADGDLALENLAVDGQGLTITGSARLADETITADISGMIDQAAGVNAALAGQAEFQLTASGPVAQPDVTLTLSGSELTVGGRSLSNLRIEAEGTLNPAAPSGTVRISGLLDGQEIVGSADVETLPNGERRISNIRIAQGPNAITGDLLLTDAFAPVGTLTLDVEDIGPLASLAGQEASGDVTGTIELRVDADGTPVAEIDATAEQLTVAGNTLSGVTIDVAVEDYLGMPFVEGTIVADAIEAGGLTVTDLDIALSREGEFTSFTGMASINGVESELAGRVRFEPDATTVELRTLTAAIEGTPVALSEPAAVTLAEGGITLTPIRIEVGDGAILVEGTIADTYDLTVEINAIPVAVANPFVEGLGASGTISGVAEISGSAGDPNAVFRIEASDLTVAEMRASGVPPVDAVLAGTYANGTLAIETAEVTLGTGSLVATGTVGEELDLELALNELPVGLVNGFLPDLDATGTLSGTATATGSLSDPNVVFDLSGSGITAAQIAASDIPPLTLDVEGAFADGTATIETANLQVGTGSLTASGTVGEELDLEIAVNELPVGLANGFVPDLNATGTISGTATATGSLSDPNAAFDLTGTGITTEQIAASGVEPLSLDVEGTFANGTATIETAEVQVGTGSFTASGTVGEELDLELALDALPVGLVNGFVPDLNATGTISGTATATGSLSNPNAAFDLTGTGITTGQLAESGVPPLSLDVEGSFAEGTATIETASVQVGTGSLTASGTVGEELDLEIAVNELPVGLANGFLPEIDATGTISGTASATGSLSDPNVIFDLTGTGITTAQIAASGIEPLSLDVEGSFVEGTATIETANLQVGTGSLVASGTVGEELDLELAVNELPVGLVNGFVPDLDATGTISGTATATGTLSDPDAEFDLTGSGITTAQIAEAGIEPLSLDVEGAFANGTATIETAALQVGTGSLVASGTVGEALDLEIAVNELPVGLVNGFVPDLGATGTISGTAMATGSLSDPTATFDLTGSGITTAQIADSGVPPLSLDLEGSFANGTATIETANLQVGTGSLTASGTVGEELDLELALNALPVGLVNGFVPNLNATGTLSGTATATGSLSDPSIVFSITGAGITAEQIRASGVAPISLQASGQYRDGTATIETAIVDVGDGSMRASGTVGETLDIDVSLSEIPVAIANGFVPGLGAQGTLSGTVSATGSLSDPTATFDLAAANLSTAQTRAAGAPPVAVSAAGTYADGTVDLTAADIDVGGGTITVSGTAGADALDLTVELTSVPASLLAAVAPGIDPAGSISGTVRVTGPPSDPSVIYNLEIDGLSVAQTRNAGVGPLAISVDGQFANQVATIDAAISGDGLAFTVDGSVNIAGGTPQLDLAIDGTAPLSLADAVLAEGGRSLEGTVTADIGVTGPATDPNITGTISTAGASFVDTQLNLAVNDIATTITLTGETATIQSFTAELAQGGTIQVSGTVGLGDGFPADIDVRLIDAEYRDGELLAANFSAALSITGPLLESPLIAGTINADGIDIIVPENLPTSLALINVEYRNASPALLEQQREIQPPTAGTAGPTSDVRLDLTLNAPNEVFVRGRGLDVELGGSVRITGTASSPSITGGFDLIRGRFRILSQRLDFERGRVSFNGNLVPTLDFLVTADAGDVTVRIAIIGPATDPTFNFSSVPALPQDEVLARLIFGQATADLSPLQIAQLAEAAAQLAGVGGSTGLLESLRAQLGVDDLDIRTDEDGQTTVGVGQYLTENAYLGVDSSGRVSIDLDLGAGLTVRGAVSPDEPGGEFGIFYEKEY